MSITVEHGYFTEGSEARTEIEASGLHLHEVDAPASGGTPIHWHDVGRLIRESVPERLLVGADAACEQPVRQVPHQVADEERHPPRELVDLLPAANRAGDQSRRPVGFHQQRHAVAVPVGQLGADVAGMSERT